MLAAMLTLGGCIKDNSDNYATPDDGTSEMTITISVPGAEIPSTRSIAGAGGEAVVKTVDLLVFKPGAAAGDPEVLTQHAYGQSIDQTAGTSGNNYLVQFKAKLFKNTAASTIVVIANASAKVESVVGAANLGTIPAATMTKTAILGALQFASTTAWDATAANYTPIPMYGEKPLASGISYGMSKIEDVHLVRMVARVDVVNKAASQFTLSDIYLVNRNTNGYIAPAWNATSGKLLTSSDATYPYTNNLNPTLPSAPGTQSGDAGKLTYTYAHNGGAGFVGEIYTFEALKNAASAGTAAHKEAVCLIVKGTLAADGGTYWYRIDFTAGVDAAGKKPADAGFNPATVSYMPVYRNHRYTFDIVAADGRGYDSFDEALASHGVMNNLQTTLHVIDDGAINNINYNGQYYLGVGDDVKLANTSGATANVPVITNYGGGWTIDVSKGTAGIEYLSDTGWLTAVKDGANNIKVTTASANTGAERSAWVHVIAGRLTNKVKITQVLHLVTPPPGITDEGNAKDITTYVGAFWRADQCGERLITIPITNAIYAGRWVVQVYEYGTGFSEGDILFSAAPSTDLVAWNKTAGTPDDMLAPADDIQHLVTDGTTYLTGDAVATGGEIKFRVGMRTRWDNQPRYATQKVRYAKIIILFGQNYQYQRIIWVRHGHEPDYLISKNDVPTDYQAYVRKFSPYNLTAPGMSNAVYTNISVAYGGVFTDYPSQAGGMFQWAGISGYERLAWHPSLASVSGWNNSNDYSSWVSGTYETCPTVNGVIYRRPTSAPTGATTTSELGRSLLSDVSKSTETNSVWGYYADGFFDRRSCTASNNNVEGSVVDNSLFTAAYVGLMFYNDKADSPCRHASIFFPAAGLRHYTDGVLRLAGDNCYYWTSSAKFTSDGYAFFVNSGGTVYYGNFGDRTYGMSIRCVVE